MYIRFYNEEGDRYRPEKPLQFAKAIIKKLNEYVNGKLIVSLSKDEAENVLLLVIAYKTLL